MTDEVKNEALESDGRRRVKIGEDTEGRVWALAHGERDAGSDEGES